MSASAISPALARAKGVAIPQHALVVGVSLLIFAPSMLFATTLRPLPALSIFAGSAGALSIIVTGAKDRSATIDLGHLALCTLAALALLVLGGGMHFFAPTWDWLTRDAVLADLVRGGPVGYRIDGADYLLRAPLGMYMLPALVGRGFGLHAAHGTLLAQNAVILGAIFALLTTIGRGFAHLAILVLFAGLSVVGAWLRAGGAGASQTPFWLLWGLDGWHPMFQYSSTLVQLFWVPNHALPGWWLATLILLQARGRADVATLGITVAGCLFWSPLSIVPIAPWLLFCVLRAPRAVLADRRIWLGAIAAAAFLPVAIYLVAGAGDIANGSLVGRPDFSFWYRWFITLQLPALCFVALAWRQIEPCDRAPLIAAALILLAFPFFRFGPNNDLVMRASIAPLAVVAFVFGGIVVNLTRERRHLAAAAGWLLVAATAPAAIVEIGRALATPTYAISDCSLMEATTALNETGVPTNYVASLSAMPDWLMDAPAQIRPEATKRDCWPGRSGPRVFGTDYNR